MQIRLGTTVFGRNRRKSSNVDRVLLNPHNWEVTYVVVRTGRRQPSLKLVPVSLIERWEPKGVVLRLTSDELLRMPDYLERDYYVPRGLLASASPPRGRNLPSKVLFTQPGFPFGPGVLPHTSTPTSNPIVAPVAPEPPVSGPIELRGGAVAEAADGEVGRIERLLLDTYMNQVTSFVVSAGGAFDRDVPVPLEWVTFVSPDRVRFGATRSQLEHLVGPPAGNFLATIGTIGGVMLRRAV